MHTPLSPIQRWGPCWFGFHPFFITDALHFDLRPSRSVPGRLLGSLPRSRPELVLLGDRSVTVLRWVGVGILAPDHQMQTPYSRYFWFFRFRVIGATVQTKESDPHRELDREPDHHLCFHPFPFSRFRCHYSSWQMMIACQVLQRRFILSMGCVLQLGARREDCGGKKNR